MAANLQSVRTLCHGCLSADRELSPIAEFSDMFNVICAKRTRIPGLKYTSLCWECTATLKRMQTFHKQVNNAQTLLKSYIRSKDKTLPKPLSRLKATRTTHNFISLIKSDSDEPELDIKLLDEIKEEFICEFEPYEPELGSPVTEHDKKEDFNEMDDTHNEENGFKPEENANLKQEEKKYKIEDDIDIPEASIEEKRKELLEDPTFIVQLKDLKEKQPMGRRYSHINTAEEMCVEEQARLSDLVKLWDSEQGSCVSQETVYRCLVCGHRSPSLEAARPHVARHKNVVKCLLCEFWCRGPSVARSHHRIAHMKFLCDHCGKGCSSKLLIEQHISRNHLTNKCEQCSRTFRNYRSLQAHTSAVHDEVDQSEETFCVKCNKQFKNKKRLTQHLLGTPSHANEFGKVKERVKCLACDKMYAGRPRMTDHYQYVHLGVRNYNCSDCDKAFPTRYRYKQHRIYKHEGAQRPRDKLCSVCGRGFTDNFILTNHMRTHTGERPFACALCDARFAQKVARDKHQKWRCKQDKAD